MAAMHKPKKRLGPPPHGAMEGMSPLTEYIQTEHRQGGLYSLPAFEGPDTPGLTATQKKKRKRCGVCGPCLLKTNCGTCSNCLNRKVGHQICRLRKCEQLKKKSHLWEEVGHFEDNSKDWCVNPDLAAETVLDVASVDGPRRGGQMEIGSHDRLTEGALSLEPANGASQYPSDEEATAEGGGAAGVKPEWAGSVPPGQCQAPGNGKASDLQQHLPCWGGGGDGGRTRGEPVLPADMEDARNLVAFSTSLISLPPKISSSELQPHTAQLYEKFNQEMDAEGAEVRISGGGAPEGGGQPPEDLSTLQTALSQAKHGHKPPNCNCDGPDCPDYLEWLEKRIKLAGRDDQAPCKMANAPHPHSPHPHTHHTHSHHHPQVNGAHPLSGLHQQLPRPAPIPCSPQVLSIAKEKNVSLQTAIAIEALTQLSAAGPHPHQRHHPSQHLPLHPQHGTRLLASSPGPPTSCSSSSSSHSPSSSSPFPGPGQPPGFGPHPKQQQQGSGQSNQWMMMNSSQPTPSPSGADPMSELKQLLGDASGKFTGAPFKLPVPHHHQHRGLNVWGPQPGLARIKQEPDSGEYLDSACASMGHYGLLNGQQQYPGPPLSPGSAAIRHSTQAALQQHLHHKRNLFSAAGLGPLRSPQACQDLRKWWPQSPGLEGFPLPPAAIKQEAKEPKRRKSSQASPLLKNLAGVGPPGTPVPKPKAIVIKKTKQKASLPTFLPQSQISVQKPSAVTAAQALPSPHPGSFLSPSVFNPLQSLPAPAQTQVPILVSSIAPLTAAPPVLTENTPAVSFPQPQPAAPQPQANSGGDGPPASATSSASTTPLTSAPPPATSQTLGLTSLDPKFEELIRQFEAEFGDGSFTSDPSLSQSRPPGQAPAAQPAASESQPDANANANSGPDRCASPSGAQSAPLPIPTSAPLPADRDQEMEEVDGKDKESGSQSEAASTQSQSEAALTQSQSEAASTQSQSEAASPQLRTESPTAGLRAGALPLTLPQEALMDTPQHQAPEDPFATPISPFPKRMKIESSGGLTVLSTTCFSEEDTPTKDSLPFSPSLRGFLESPLQYLSSPTQSLLDTPSKDAQADCPTCDCVEQILEKDEGPYYNHLGSGPTVASIRDLMENRYGEKGEAIRIERVIYTGREGKSSQGCPIAKWVIRRSSETEKLLCLVRHRAGHHCPNAVIVILIMVWDGVPRALGDKLYREIAESLTKFGNPTSRRCGLNDDRTCACQGKDPDTCGASFSFGCSWSMYFNGCKYARSKIPRKFRLQGERPEEEDKLRDNFQELATKVAPLYKQLAPQAYNNQCANEQKAPDCRLGLEEGRPFSGVTACMDFCAHAHKDQHNLHNGSTVVCTLTKEDNRKVGEIPEDEQLHVLPLYKLAMTDEFGSEENQRLKAQTCGLQLLHNFRREVRKLPERAKSCRQRRLEAKAKASEKKKGKEEKTPEKTVVKTEVRHTGSPHPQLGNKAIPKQEVKPIIKTEPFIKKEPFNGALEGYPAQGPDPYGLYPHPAHPAYYARGGLPPNGQPPAPGPVNGYHPNLPALPYGYYGYPTNALFPPEFVGYDGRNGPWPKAGAAAAPLDQKPDVQSLQARLAHSYPSHLDAANRVQSRPSSVSSEPCHRGTPVIKQEPEDVPVYEGGAGQSQSRAGTPCATPQPEAWPGHKPNGRMASGDWEGGARPASGPPPDSPFTPAKQQFHQQPPQQSSPYPQQKEQWNPYPAPGTPMASPAPSPSPSMKAAPSPSPSLGLSNPHHWGSPAPSPQPKAWPAGSAGYSPGAMTTHGHPAGALPDKTWPKAGESRGSTPLGLQENAWRLCGGSAAGSTPSPAPEGRSFPDALQQTDAQACWSANQAAESDAESATGHDEEVWSDSEHNFLDPNIGGVAVAPAHGSILMECARRELHATTPLKKPNRCHPTRISLVFYQHKNLNQPCHGLAMWEAKMKLLEERARQRQQEAALLGLSQEEIKAYGKKRKWGAAALAARVASGPAKDKREGPATRLSTTHHTTSTVTVSPFAFTKVTGPYSHFV